MIYFSLDDFCDEHERQLLPLIERLVKAYPDFKATMFTIPLKTSHKTISKFNAHFPGRIEHAVHGLDHRDGESWLIEQDLCAARINEHFGPAPDEKDRCARQNPAHLPDYIAGFKAPWWKLGHVAAKAFNAAGFWVAVNGTHTVDEDQLWAYNYKAPLEIAKDHIYADKSGNIFIHGHVQTQRQYNGVNPNGLVDVIDTLVTRFPADSQFDRIEGLMCARRNAQEKANGKKA